MQYRSVLLCLLVPFAAASAEEIPAPATRAGFNPDISLILAGGYAGLSNDPDNYRLPGFMLGSETTPGPRGLALGESELVITANVDDLFTGRFTAAITPENTVAVEEAYVETLGLVQGATLRAGRFLSGVGYLNNQHPHAWDFADTALPYRALLANRYGDDGVQLRWVAPTDLFVELGGEWFRGENFPAGGAGNNGQGAASLFVHAGGDVGAEHAWRAGLSALRSKPVGRLSGAIDTTPDAFSGESRVVVADLVWKWAANGNPKDRHFKFQAEAMRRTEDGVFTADVNGINGAPVADVFSSIQCGWYVQAVWQFMPRWRVGARYDTVRTRELSAGANAVLFDALGHTPRRSSVMFDYARSEFSRLRLQLTHDRSQPDAGSEVLVQYIMSLGAHGAHAF